ncbi:uncharacterized protein [Rutidosis leptorrhynchoides]|uniref:uncharacterized protein n=1 Tax=Rutidosis leptorrhynchoides TaxID=125765 RepID=UPI003A99C3D3
MGGKIDHKVNSGRGLYVYRIHGQNYHLAGSLIPEEGESPKCHMVNSSSNPYAIEFTTVHEIQGLLDAINPLVKKFRMARDIFAMNEREPIPIKLIGSSDKDGRTHNLPTADEVAAIIVGDVDEDGYRTDMYHRGVDLSSEPGHNNLTIREFFAYRVQARVGEVSLILLSRKLLQQFIVDAYTMVENTRLNYIRNNQKILRVTPYSNLYDAQENGHQEVSDIGNRVILLASFTGGARYLQQNYLDAMAIIRAYGHPDLFITFTCNPKWPKILIFLSEDNLNPEDMPDIICRVFKIKLDALMHKFKREKTFGKLLGDLYRKEFQKRGLQHAHIWLFLDKKDKVLSPDDIDNFITAEIPNKDTDPELYSIVSEFMIHGPCGPKHSTRPCMTKQEFCSKHFPKDFIEETHFDGAGYPRYKSCQDGTLFLTTRN